MSTDAPWWDNPSAAAGDNPVVRHAVDDDKYHLPDQAMAGKISHGRVRQWATIPASDRDGASKGFDPSVAGLVHVDPGAPDGGVIFDPSTVRKSAIENAVATAKYPHQVFYQLGTPASRARTKEVDDADYTATNIGVDRTPNPYMRAYVTPHVVPQLPQYVANGIDPRTQTQETFVPLPPLTSLPPIPYGATPQPQPEASNMPATIPQQYAQGPPPGSPHPGGYGQPQYHPMPQPAPQLAYYQQPGVYTPPPLDPQLVNILATLQNQVAALSQQQHNQALPKTTGLSAKPLPTRRTAGHSLATLPAEHEQTHRPIDPRWSEQSVESVEDGGGEDFDARPIRRQVKRAQDTGEIIEQIEEVEESSRSLMRQAPSKQKLKDYQNTLKEPNAVIAGFETLELDFVKGPIAEKAKRQVLIEIPGIGKQLARFHDVVVAKGCVALIYDTRYEEGQQYLPENFGDKPLKVHVSGPKRNESICYPVASMGLTFNMGVLDVIVLVRLDVKEEEEDEAVEE